MAYWLIGILYLTGRIGVYIIVFRREAIFVVFSKIVKYYVGPYVFIRSVNRKYNAKIDSKLIILYCYY